MLRRNLQQKKSTMFEAPICDLAGKVRVAMPSDEEELMDACRRAYATGEWGLRYGDGSPLPYAPDRVRSTIQKAIIRQRNDPDGGQAVIGIAGEPGKLEGSVYLYVSSTFVSDAPFLMELWNYVFPAYRKSDNAKALIAFSKAVANIMRMPLVMGVMSHERTEAKCRLYSRALGRPALGSFFLYNGDCADDSRVS